MNTEDQQQPSRILVVDDDPNIRDVLQFSLEREGYAVTLAGNGREALHYISNDGLEHPDLIVLDLMMPETSGLEVLRRLKENENTARIPVLVLTVKDSLTDTATGLNTGADFYWTKPFEVTELVRAIKLILEVEMSG
jgi:DNA-binding response OmpR family regulator